MKKKWPIIAGILIIVMIICLISFRLIHFEYAYMPPKNKILSSENRSSEGSYDIWGSVVSKKEAARLKDQHKESVLSAKNGAVKVDDSLLHLGRKTFYKETFGNEVFLTDILGVIDGPLTIWGMGKAIIALKGEGTTNLRVELAKSAVIGGRTFKKGEIIDTGIDVARGSNTPLGMPISVSDGRIRVGISCAACHATVSSHGKKVLEGVTNPDLNTGLIMALAPNTASYFTHSEVSSLRKFISKNSSLVTNTKGEKELLPDQVLLENSIDGTLLKWSRGNFDSSIDMKSNPTQVPDSFTLGDHPYSWSGFGQAGSFKGLSAFSNNVHAQNADPLSQSEISKALFNVDKEVYLGTMLQNSANPRFRYNPKSNEKPSEFFNRIDPTPGAPGVNEIIKPPSFPHVTLIAPDGLIVSSHGYKVYEQNNSVSAWQNTLKPPKPELKRNSVVYAQGERMFNRAGCTSCHAGRALTNNKIVAATEIGTEPTRAAALKKTENIFGESVMFAPSVNVPINKGATVNRVPTNHLDEKQIELAFAKGKSSGGYKTPSLIGLFWSAPYLHDGGVSVGPRKDQLGMPGTLMKGIIPDPENSLRALVDSEFRAKVVKANHSSKNMRDVRIKGIGHEFWVDKTTGFTKKDQDALIHYLLTYYP
jgi:hypothetical protein